MIILTGSDEQLIPTLLYVSSISLIPPKAAIALYAFQQIHILEE